MSNDDQRLLLARLLQQQQFQQFQQFQQLNPQQRQQVSFFYLVLYD